MSRIVILNMLLILLGCGCVKTCLIPAGGYIDEATMRIVKTDTISIGPEKLIKIHYYEK